MAHLVVFFVLLSLLGGSSLPIPIQNVKHFQGLVESPTTIVSPLSLAELIVNPRLTYWGGPIVPNVQVLMVLWGTGTYLPEISGTTMQQWWQDILGSSFFDWLSEYNQTINGQTTKIGLGSFSGNITINPSCNGPVITDAQIRLELQAQINQGVLPFNQQMIYMIYFPAGISILYTGLSCVTFCGYHGGFKFMNQQGSTLDIKYGVIPDLTPLTCQLGCGAGNSFQQTCQVCSHEIAEIVTDPDILEIVQLIYHLASWYDLVNGEIGDICLTQTGNITVDGRTSYVQKLWSDSERNCIISKDFAIGYSIPTEQILQNSSVTATITVVQLGGSSQIINFSIQSSLPTGVQSSLSPLSLNSGIIQLTITATSNAQTGDFNLQVVAQGSLYQKTLNIPLSIMSSP